MLTGGRQSRRIDALMTLRTYEITFAGEAVPAIVAAFEELDVVVGAGHTTLRAEKVDQAALYGVMDRLRSLGLELLEVQTVDRTSP